MEFLDLFLPNPASSASRARVFLWLCYHYHEGSSVGPGEDADVGRANPFSDPSSPGKAPSLVMLTPDEIALENLDPADEKALATRFV
jgi:Ino eighty subunit 1